VGLASPGIHLDRGPLREGYRCRICCSASTGPAEQIGGAATRTPRRKAMREWLRHRRRLVSRPHTR
jgi:hypothetical protein